VLGIAAITMGLVLPSTAAECTNRSILLAIIIMMAPIQMAD